MNIDYPLHFDARGATAATDYPDHVRDMIEQLLFTRPGERVNRPDFGCGLLDLVFELSSPELAATLQVSAAGALARWLGDVIAVDELTVTAQESTLRVELRYVLLATGATVSTTLQGGAS
jgi:phage baseplate assembly protein W